MPRWWPKPSTAVVEAVEPKVKLHSRYRQKLEPCIRRTIDHLRSLVREPLEPVLLNRAAWASDPRVNAFFATADDVPACLGAAMSCAASSTAIPRRRRTRSSA